MQAVAPVAAAFPGVMDVTGGVSRPALGAIVTGNEVRCVDGSASVLIHIYSLKKAVSEGPFSFPTINRAVLPWMTPKACPTPHWVQSPPPTIAGSASALLSFSPHV